MTTTPDRRPGPLEEDEEIRLIPNIDPPTQAGAFNYDGTSFVMQDSIGVFNPREMTEEQHSSLDTLDHWVDQNSYDEVIRVGGKVVQITVWDSPLKTIAIREEFITRTNGKVSQIVSKQYDRNTGILKETLTELYSRVGGRIASVVRTRTP